MSEFDSESLRVSYCPPIDDAVFYALASDYHGSELISLLDGLKAAALEEEKTAFDPSGTGGAVQQEADLAGAGWCRSTTTPEEGSASNGLTGTSSDLGDLRLQDDGTSINQLEPDEQVRYLHGLFPSLSLDRVRSVCSAVSSSDQAIEELLNLSFLADQGGGGGGGDVDLGRQEPVPKGVEWFAEEFRAPRQRGRRRGGKSSLDVSPAPTIHGSAGGGAQNVWKAAAGDVEFICSKTTLERHVVRSTYHANGASLPLTIRAFAEGEGAKRNGKLNSVDEIVEQQIAEIGPLFPSVPKTQILGLLRLTRYMPSAVHELLVAMTAPAAEERDLAQEITATMIRHPPPLELVSNRQSSGRLHQQDHPRPSRQEGETEWTTVRGRSTRGHPSPASATRGDGGVGQAFEQASQAYRKSKSNPLYGGAAAYYAQVGHERLKQAKAATVAEANALAEAHSTATTLDLHGIDVQNAVRIAQHKTQQWWDGLGDAKYARGGGGGGGGGGGDTYRIITGVGSHSKNLTPQIGPAVAKRLVNEGWKIEILHGEIVVVGKRARR